MTATGVPPISLDNLTVVGVSPTEYVEIAAAAGYDAISPFVGGSDVLPSHNLAVGDDQTEEMIVRLADRGLWVNNLDGLVVTPKMDWDAYARMIELAVHIGARRGVTLIFDNEPTRARDSFCRLVEMADVAGLKMVMEFSKLCPVGTLEEAAVLVRQAPAHVGLIVDLMHLAYAGGKPQDLVNYEIGLIECAQLCDAFANTTFKEYQLDALFQRQIPGDGDLPVVEFLSALPPDAPIGIEVPLKSLADAGMSHLDRATLLLERTRSLLAEAGRS